MKLFIVALKGTEYQVMPQFARDSLRCAQLFSGMEVVGLSDFVEDGWFDASPYAERAFAFRKNFIAACGIEARELPCIMRWFIIEDYLRAHGLTDPIMQIDWEVLVFGDLEAHCRRCGAADADIGDTVSKNLPDHNRTAPYWVNNLSAIHFFTAMMEAQVKCKTPLLTSHKCGGDMNWWEHARAEGGYTPVDISRESGDAIFDLNILLDRDIYEDYFGAKRLFWVDGKPHFKRRSDGGLVKAVAVHCFWTWKDKTSDILKKATSSYSDE